MTNNNGASTIFASLKIVSWVAIALMVLAMLYAGWLAITNWTFIKV